MNKAYKIRLYPNKSQQELINKTIGCSRFIYNKMLDERINVYEEFKNDKDALYSYKYKTEKEYKQEYEWLCEVSSYALQQSHRDLDSAYKNFYRRVKKKDKQKGFPKFKSSKTSKLSYRDSNVNGCIKIKNNKIQLPKLGYVKFRGLNNTFQGIIKSVTIIKNKDTTYEASILVEQDLVLKKRKGNNNIGLDWGLKEFLTCSNGEVIHGIKEKLYEIEKEIKVLQRHHGRKQKGSKNKEKVRIKIAKKFKYMKNIQNHFFWHLANKLCSENQTIIIEDLNVKGMMTNYKIAHSVSYAAWGTFVIKLLQKAIEYDTKVIKIDRWFPSSKLCSKCGQLKEDLTLGDRTYICDCGNNLDRDLNASINILKAGLNALSAEYVDYSHGEIVRLLEFDSKSNFNEVIT